MEVIANGFELYKNEAVQISAGQVQQLKISLTIQAEQQQVEVTAQPSAVDVNPSNNAGAIIINGPALDALPDDPDELQTDLTALAGPSAGPNGGQFYIDGFTAGQLPPKSSIREIRINQNPFSAEYDKVGYGRVEIFTKPGTDKWHGQFAVNGNDSAFNSRNPYFNSSAATGGYPGYYSVQYEREHRRAAEQESLVFLYRAGTGHQRFGNRERAGAKRRKSGGSLQRRGAQSEEAVQLRAAAGLPVSKNNTLTVRYQYYRNTEDNDGVGGFALPSQGYNSLTTEQTLQVGDTQVFGTKSSTKHISSTCGTETTQTPLSTLPSVIVPLAFNGGGSSSGLLNDIIESIRIPELHIRPVHEAFSEIRRAAARSHGQQ